MQLLGGGAVFMVWGALWGFQVVPTLSCLGTSYPSPPTVRPPPPLQPPPPGRALLLPLSPGPGWLGVSRKPRGQVCPKNRRPEQWLYPLLTGMPGEDLKGPSLCVCITIFSKSIL